MTLTVRPATEADLPSLLALFAEWHPRDPVLEAGDAVRIWRDIATQSGRYVLVAVTDDAVVVGTADCAVLPNLTRGGRAFLQLENVVVAATHRRAGVGRRLMREAEALARLHGCYKMQLLTGPARGPAHSFYESSGMQPIAAGYRRYFE